MSRLVSEFRLIIRRSLANWRLLSTLMVGVLIAVSLLSSAPLFSNAINDLGLKRSLHDTDIQLLDIQVNTPYDYVNEQTYNNNSDFINQQASRNIEPIIRQRETFFKTDPYFLTRPGQPDPTGAMRPTGYFQGYSNLKDHIKILEGTYPQPTAANLSQAELKSPDFYVEGMIGRDTANMFKLKVGDEIVFISGYGIDERRITVKLTAIIEPIDITEEYWFSNSDVFTVPMDPQGNTGQVAPIFIPYQTLFNGVAGVIPATKATFNWLYFVNVDKIDSSNAIGIKNAVSRMDQQIIGTLPRSGMMTTLDSVIKQYQAKLLYTQIPLFLIVSQIIAIILYYLITVSNMLIEKQAAEIALFRSRGASTRQIVGIYFVEGLIIAALGGAVGPFLGASVFSLMGETASFRPLSGGSLLPIRFSGTVFLLAGIAALLCLLTLLVPAIQSARRGVVTQRQKSARPAEAPVWQRFYLDLVILAFGGALYWELHSRGSLLSISTFSGMGIDPLLLITPMLLIAAVAIVFLRFFPMLISLTSRLSRFLKNTPVALGLWYIARNPVHYGRLILLLIMAASVGMFAATFLGTLNNSYSQRTMYTAGSDVRLQKLNVYQSTLPTLEEKYSKLPGVEDASFAYRVDGTVGTMFTQTPVTLLGVEPDKLPQVSWYRSDFSSQTLPQLMDTLQADQPQQQGLLLPHGTEKLGIWVDPEPGNPQMQVFATLRDGKGRLIQQELGTTDNATWQLVESPLYSISTGGLPVEPVSLVNIFVRYMGDTRFWGNQNGVHLDDLQAVVSGSDKPVILDNFDHIGNWSIAIDSSSGSYTQTSAGQDSLTLSSTVTHSGTGSFFINWSNSRGFTEKGIFANMDERPLTAIASQTFLNATGNKVGNEIMVRIPGEFVPVVIKDVVNYFPTLDPQSKGFLIVNLNRLTAGERMLEGIQIFPNEAWLKLTNDPTLRATTMKTLNYADYGAAKTYDSQQMLANLKADPLAGAGWGGVLLIAFLGVVLVSSLGFIVYNYLSAQSRQLDFAVLRTLGFSLKQIIGLVCFEQLFIIIVGLGIGTAIGRLMSSIMLPFLQLTEKGARVLPPFAMVINWQTIGIAYAVIGLAFIITITLVIAFFSRVAIYRTLRMGDL